MNLLRAGAKAANRRHHEGKDGATGFRLLNRANVAAPPSQNPTTNWIYRSTHRRAERGEGAQIIAGSALETWSERRPASDRRPLHDGEAGSLQMLDQALGDDRRHELVGAGTRLRPCAENAQSQMRRNRGFRSRPSGRAGTIPA